jgi:membrane protease YdiL (CAAX protease family)
MIMQEPFELENNTEICAPAEDGQIPFDPEAAEGQRREAAKKKLSFAANRIGWATALLVGVWMGAIVIASVFAGFMGENGAVFYNRFYLILNEVTLAIGIAVALVVLLSVSRVFLHKNKISAGGFLKILVMCFGAGYVGNLIGTAWLTLWNIASGNSVGNELVTLLDGMNPLIMFISVGVLAPILEEMFFRKLLIDRLRVFGETASILITALLFALFHMSVSQLVYAFTIGVLLGYFYCRTGNYPLTVLIHAIFNTVSGVIPMLFLPKVTAFSEAMASLEASIPLDATLEEMADMMAPLLAEYGLAVGLYALYALAIFAINITGVILLIVNFKKFRARKGEFSLNAEDTVKTVCKTPGFVVCIALLVIMTVFSLFG